MRCPNNPIKLLVYWQSLQAGNQICARANYHMMDQANEISKNNTATAKTIANVMHDDNLATADKSTQYNAFLQSHNLKQGLIERE